MLGQGEQQVGRQQERCRRVRVGDMDGNHRLLPRSFACRYCSLKKTIVSKFMKTESGHSMWSINRGRKNRRTQERSTKQMMMDAIMRMIRFCKAKDDQNTRMTEGTVRALVRWTRSLVPVLLQWTPLPQRTEAAEARVCPPDLSDCRHGTPPVQ
jgi:hypothetical protein